MQPHPTQKFPIPSLPYHSVLQKQLLRLLSIHPQWTALPIQLQSLPNRNLGLQNSQLYITLKWNELLIFAWCMLPLMNMPLSVWNWVLTDDKSLLDFHTVGEQSSKTWKKGRPSGQLRIFFAVIYTEFIFSVFVDRYVKDALTIWGVKFSPDGRLLATGANDHQVRVCPFSLWELPRI